jgi:micrococcal nuclease
LISRTSLRALLAIVWSLASIPAVGQLPVVVGTVTRVVDGDTIDVQLSSGPIRVRLHGVDTPERGQPYSNIRPVQ